MSKVLCQKIEEIVTALISDLELETPSQNIYMRRCHSNATLSAGFILNKNSGEKMKKYLMLMLGLSILAGSQHAYAVDADANPIFTNRVVLGLGGFYAKTDAVIGAEDLNSPLKAEIDFDDLGLDESTVAPMAYGLLRLGNRWRIELDYTNIEQDGSGFIDSWMLAVLLYRWALQ